MLKKAMAFILSILLLAALAVPALGAQESVDAQLARVTLTVKNTLGIDDRYTEFNGNLTEDSGNGYWQLYWSGENESLNVTADKNGKVLSYNQYTYDDSIVRPYYGGTYNPVFSKTTRADAQPAAEAFLKKVLDKNESYVIEEEKYYILETWQQDSYYFSGTVLINGLPSPVTYSIRVKTADMTVTSFYRSDCYSQFVGPIPSPTPAVSLGSARKQLEGTVKLELQYVAEGDRAVLRYVSVGTGSYIVDANTGKLVDLTDLYRSAYDYADEATGAATPQEAKSNGLSPAEQATVDALEGVYGKEKLDSMVRAMTELGVDSRYVLSALSYSRNTETGEVSATLSYAGKIDDKAEIQKRWPEAYERMAKTGIIEPVGVFKYVTVDAFTGKLMYITSYSGYKEATKVTTDKMTENAKAFMKKYFADLAAESALYDASSAPEEGRFHFARQANGIFFLSNTAYVTVNPYNGTIDNFYSYWTKDITFDSPEGIVSASAAMTAWLDCFDTSLEYVAVPVNTDTYYPAAHKLILAYRLNSEAYPTAVDAKTGKVVFYETGSEPEPVAYDDIAGSYARAQIETLATYGIGFPGKSFEPRAQLTQKDALVLLLSAVGYTGQMDDDYLYDVAYSYRLLTRSQRAPEALMTREALIKMLIGATEYAPAAELKGVYKTGFNDDAKISPECYGYVAIAKALNIVRGDTKNNFNPAGIVTRQDAAIILYNFMSR